MSNNDMRKFINLMEHQTPITEFDDDDDDFGAPASIRMSEIADEIANLANEALELLPRNTVQYQRARSYWYGHIMSAVGDSQYDSGHQINMQTSIKDLEEIEETGSEDDDY